MSELDDFGNSKPADYILCTWVRERDGREYAKLSRITHYVSEGGYWTSAGSDRDSVVLSPPAPGYVSSGCFFLKEVVNEG